MKLLVFAPKFNVILKVNHVWTVEARELLAERQTGVLELLRRAHDWSLLELQDIKKEQYVLLPHILKLVAPVFQYLEGTQLKQLQNLYS